VYSTKPFSSFLASCWSLFSLSYLSLIKVHQLSLLSLLISLVFSCVLFFNNFFLYRRIHSFRCYKTKRFSTLHLPWCSGFRTTICLHPRSWQISIVLKNFGFLFSHKFEIFLLFCFSLTLGSGYFPVVLCKELNPHDIVRFRTIQCGNGNMTPVHDAILVWRNFG